MSVPNKVLKSLEHSLYSNVISTAQNHIKYPLIGMQLQNLFDNDGKKISIPKHVFSDPKTQSEMKKQFHDELHKCRAYVGKSFTDIYLCGRDVYNPNSNNEAERTFCLYHGLCNHNSREYDYEEKEMKNHRCNKFRTKLSTPFSQLTSPQIDSDFSFFCKTHDEVYTPRCRNLNTTYQKKCKDLDEENEVDSITNNNLTLDKCSNLFECFNSRTEYKNNCSSYTEDNGHSYARKKLLHQLQRCNLKYDSVGQKFTRTKPINNDPKTAISLDHVKTLKQPWIIDQYNQQYDNLIIAKKSGGAPRRKHTSRRRRKQTSRRRHKQSSRKRRTTKSRR